MTTEARAERMRSPLAMEVITATAEQHGVCVRPFTMEAGDLDTGELRYVPVPCGSTVESQCGPCARKARALRIVQCREGWHATAEPGLAPRKPTEDQTALLAFRADLVAAYRDSLTQDRLGEAEELREEIRSVDEELRQLGMRGRLPNPDGPGPRPVKRSTKRRQDVPELPRRKVEARTLGREYAGRFRPSMFVTLTCDTYGRVRDDGTPVDPKSYDYRRAARDAVHFASLVDRWWQNLRRCVGWDVQYFSTVEPQKRAAPHLHAAIRGSIPHEVLRQVTAATYHQVWWPQHDEPLYGGDQVPVWDSDRRSFVDPDTRRPLTLWADAVEDVNEPAHVVTFGRQVHSKGLLGGTEEAGRHIGYLTKYLTKSIGEVVEATTDRQRAHHNRLHAELAVRGLDLPGQQVSGWLCCWFPVLVLGVDLVGGLVAKSRVEALFIVAHFNIGGDVGHGVFARGVDYSMDALVLQNAKERFSHGVIIANSGASDGLPDPQRPERVRELR